MGWGNQDYRAPPCPGCGKPDAARYHSGRWKHRLSCCSDVCGDRVEKILDELHAGENYGFFRLMALHAEEQMAELEHDALCTLREGYTIANNT